MGAVVSCVESVFRAIGQAVMAVINGLGSIIMAIVKGVVRVFEIVVSFLTCNSCGSRRGRLRGRRRSGM